MVQFTDASATGSNKAHSPSIEAELTTDEAAKEKQLKQETNKLQKRLRRDAGRAFGDFKMIDEGARSMVC